jgi:hypothetical protein
MTMSSTHVIHGNTPSRPRNWLLKPGDSQLVAGPVTINNAGGGRVVAAEVDGSDSPLSADVTEFRPGEALEIPVDEHRRLGVDQNTALWYDWPI